MLASVLRRYNEMQKNMSNIIDNLYISDIEGVKNISILRDKKISHVVSLTKKSIFQVSNIRYTQIMIDDVDSVDFVNETLVVVDEVIEYIKNKINVLVHCYKGLSRSVSFVILLLVRQGYSFRDAYELVQKKKRNNRSKS